MLRNRTLALAVLAGTAVAGSASAASIGIDFGPGSSSNGLIQTALAPNEVAGAPGVAQSNWNSPTGTAHFGTLGSLTDSAGATTAATVTWSFGNTWSTNVPGNEDNNGFSSGSSDEKLFTGYVENGNATLTVSGLSAALGNTAYDVYVYALTSVAGRSGTYTVSGATTGNASKIGNSAVKPSAYIEDPGGANDDGDYLRFTGVSGDSFTLSVVGLNSVNGGTQTAVNAIQIVPVPEPTGLGVLGLMGVGALARRRRQA